MSGARLFSRSNAPQRGLLAVEKIVVVYVVVTLVAMFFLRTRLTDVGAMLMLRGEVIAGMIGGYIIYKVYPCAATLFLRVAIQLLFLGAWYSDTFALNCCLPNLDHLFCAAEQSVFGCQPSLVLSQNVSSPVVSELLDMAYAAFYPIIAVVILLFFFRCRPSFLRAAYIVTATFIVYFLLFDILPVAGPTFYFCAVGVDVIEEGVFPSLGYYFASHASLAADSLPTPGWHDGVMWQLVELAKAAGERPTAAFPSSHIGISTVCLFLLWKAKCKGAFWSIVPFVALMLVATVYIQAHYALDVAAGLVSGVLIYYLTAWSYPLFSRR